MNGSGEHKSNENGEKCQAEVSSHAFEDYGSKCAAALGAAT